MGAYSTLFITRSKAKNVILNKIMGSVSDDRLASFMDEYLEPRLYNCCIVNDDDANDDDKI